MPIIIAFIANSVLHIISFLNLKKSKSPNATGVLVFVFINAIIAYLLWKDIEWAKWVAVIFPILGGIGLLMTTIMKGKGQWVDYLIFILDIVIVYLVLNLYIL